MQLSEQGRALIKRCEGVRLEPYCDPAGVLTIGYGHRILPPATYEHGITLATAEQILDDDVALAEKIVASLIRVELTQGQFDALVDFAFNLGGSALQSSTLLRLLNFGQYDAAGEQLLKWDHARQGGGEIEMPGLEARREAELALWRQPAAQKSGNPVQPAAAPGASVA